MLDGSFEAGFRTGIWKLYNEDGSVSSSQNYESDFYKSIRKAEPDIYYYGDDAMFVEKMPEFQGGDEQRIMFLVKNLTYPNDARLKNIQGTVWVNFVVSITGEIESARIITSVSESLDNEVIKLVMLMPRWNPGLQGGIPVRVSFNMPVKFTLQ